MEYHVFQIKDICTIKSGKRLPKGDDFSTEITDYGYIRARDIKNGRINAGDLVYITKETQSKIKKYIVNKGDIVITIVGASVGDTAYVTSKFEGMNLTENAVRLTKFDMNIINSIYLSYYIGQSFMKRHMEILASGAAQPKLGIYKIEKIKILLPKVDIQHRIASILSTYDTLIENNTKRIRLLEKMAENLYKEWFVRFRFPGHEKVEMVNGLPKGWKRGSLSDVCEFKRGKNITSSEMEKGNVPVISAGLETSGYHSHSNVKGTSVTMSSSGANAGYIAIHYSDIWAADCSYIEESNTRNIYYVYELLNNIRGVITNFQRGAAQPHVYPKDINRIKLLLPSDNLMQKANERLAMMHKEIDNLQHQNTLLARQRDLLLPRLMSGKLEVKGCTNDYE